MMALPADANLPALATLFEPQRMLAALQPQTDAVTRCDIERIKYRPDRSCVVAYRLARADAAPLRFAVCMYGAREIAARYRKALAVDGSARLIDELNAVVWAFPADRKLPALPLLADAASARALWLESLVREYRPGWRLDAAQLEVVSFFPEHGATVRAQLRLRGARGGRRDWIVYGQTRYDNDAARAFAVMKALERAARRTRAERGAARALLYDAERRVLWQEAIDAPLLAAQFEREDSVDWSAIARVLLRAQSCTDVALPLERSAAQLRIDLTANAEIVGHALPQQAEAVDRLCDVLRQRMPDENSEDRLVHGDLHSRNVLTRGSRAWLIDFDRVARGDPLADVASLAAELLYRDCLSGADQGRKAASALLAAYRRSAPWPASREALAWNVAAALLRERVYRAVTSLKPGRIAAIPRLLAAADRCLKDSRWIS